MKNFIWASAIVAASISVTSPAAAQSNQELCTTYSAYDLGVRKGSTGESVAQADWRAKKCLKHGVTLDKDEYLRGLAVGNKSYCTAERGRQDLADNQSPARACRITDNPYIWEFRGQPLVNMPSAGDASFARAKQDLPLDLDYLRGVYSKTQSIQGENVGERVALSRLGDRLKVRINGLEKQKNGQAILPSAVNSPGPNYRKGMTGNEVISGMFKASNWKSGNDVTPMRIRKKNCKAGDWAEYGMQHGRFGADIEEEIAEATKKCAKHDIVFNEAEYKTGFNKSLVDYCGYERGFFTALADNKANANCAQSQFPNYAKGYKHGETRSSFTGAERNISRLQEMYDNVVRYYNKGSFSPFDTILPELDVKSVFGSRKNVQRFISNDRIRLTQLESKLAAHKSQYPELYQTQELGVEPRPDSELDYQIPF